MLRGSRTFLGKIHRTFLPPSSSSFLWWRHLAVQVGTTKEQVLYNKPSAAVHPGVLAAGSLPQYSRLQYSTVCATTYRWKCSRGNKHQLSSLTAIPKLCPGKFTLHFATETLVVESFVIWTDCIENFPFTFLYIPDKNFRPFQCMQQSVDYLSSGCPDQIPSEIPRPQDYHLPNEHQT